ncbi:MAG TPA: 2-C-methyl-D-erythritol 4-phosphate cytidylyltransferase [Chloroflexota bacterium]
MVGAIVVAAGRAERMGGKEKVWAPLGAWPVVGHALVALRDAGVVERVALVVTPERLDDSEALLRRVGLPGVACVGGARRQDSVRAGLVALGPCEWVVVHDGARPFVTPGLVRAGLRAARKTGAAVAAVPVTDTIKLVADSLVEATLPRERLRAVQTPQVFRYDLLWEAHHRPSPPEATDDAALVEALGHPVVVYPGAYDNIKITTPEDLVLAEHVCRRRRCE